MTRTRPIGVTIVAILVLVSGVVGTLQERVRQAIGPLWPREHALLVQLQDEREGMSLPRSFEGDLWPFCGAIG